MSRVMKLYTRTGDDGSTLLFGGVRVGKDHPRVVCYGTVDEVNSVLGWAASAVQEADLLDRIGTVQKELFTIGAELASPDGQTPKHIPPIDSAACQRLERWIDAACADPPELTRFLLPGGCEAAGRMHVVRTVCRRAERLIAQTARAESFSPHILVYLNRLSDLLFAWARQLNHRAGVAEPLWDPAGDT